MGFFFFFFSSPGSGGRAELGQVGGVGWRTEGKLVHVGVGFERWETVVGRVRAR